LAPPLIRIENGVAEIVGKCFGKVFFVLNFDSPREYEITFDPRG
jgi:hypothetical protein